MIKYGIFGADKHYDYTIVFVHGTLWSSVVFKPLTKVLLARGEYCVVLYDLAGYGQSQNFVEGGSPKDGELFVGGR